MRIVQVTPGAGAMYCGNCLRDNALVGAWRRLGHDVLMVPLYLPLTLDEPDQSAGTPIFFGGINVYLEQKSALFRSAPGWLHWFLARRGLLQWASGRAAGTNPSDLGAVTVSMLRGEDGHQRRELDEFIRFLKPQPRADVICLSNALLLGMAHRLKTELGTRLACTLQGEDTFLDALPEPHRTECWSLMSDRAKEVDVFIAPSRYFGELMRNRIHFAAERLRIAYNGINLEGYDVAPPPGSTAAPALGYLARMCPQKGLDQLVDAYIVLRQDPAFTSVRLRIGGSCGPADEPFVNGLRQKLKSANLLESVNFCPNLNRSAKIEFLQSLAVFSVPALYGEAFGLYVLEAMAAGVPVVQPATAAFPELVEATGGGILCTPGSPGALAEAIGSLLKDRKRAQLLGTQGRRAVFERFNAGAMAERMLEALAGK